MGYSSKSPWVIHYDGSSCNGCDIEVLDSMAPLYDVERFGIINTGNPKHADIFLVTGSVNHQNQNVVRHIYDQMLEPKVVVACGVCACTGGVFRECYNILGGVDKVIPVDVYAPGCAVRPETIIDAVLEGVKILDKKAELMKKGELKTLSSAEYAERRAAEGKRFGEPEEHAVEPGFDAFSPSDPHGKLAEQGAVGAGAGTAAAASAQKGSE